MRKNNYTISVQKFTQSFKFKYIIYDKFINLK